MLERVWNRVRHGKIYTAGMVKLHFCGHIWISRVNHECPPQNCISLQSYARKPLTPHKKLFCSLKSCAPEQWACLIKNCLSS